MSELQSRVGIEFGVSLSKEDKYHLIESMLELSIKELESIASDPRTPSFMVVLAKSICMDAKRGRMNTLNDVLDRFFGKATQPKEVTGKGGGPIELQAMNAETLTPQERDQLRELITKCGDGSA